VRHGGENDCERERPEQMRLLHRAPSLVKIDDVEV
jgi:hypothetical protein